MYMEIFSNIENVTWYSFYSCLCVSRNMRVHLASFHNPKFTCCLLILMDFNALILEVMYFIILSVSGIFDWDCSAVGHWHWLNDANAYWWMWIRFRASSLRRRHNINDMDVRGRPHARNTRLQMCIKIVFLTWNNLFLPKCRYIR